MIVVRDVFRVKFGQMRDALAALVEAKPLFEAAGENMRALTDLTGPYYTLVLESTHPDLATYEARMKDTMTRPEWQAWYRGFSAYVESGSREICTIAL